MGKLKDFVKKHKTELIIGAGVLTAFIVGRHLVQTPANTTVIVNKTVSGEKDEDLFGEVLSKYLSSAYKAYGDGPIAVAGIYDEGVFGLSDLGKLGEIIKGDVGDVNKYTHFLMIGPGCTSDT